LPDLLEVELLMWDKGWYEDSVADIDNLFNRIDKELEKQRILNQYRRYRCIVRKAHLDMNRNINTDFMDGDAFKSEAQATSLRAKIEYYSALATHSFMTGKVEDAYKCNQQLLIIYEENPSLIDIFPKKYILTLSHYLADSLKLKKYAELESGKEKMNQSKPWKYFIDLSSIRSLLIKNLLQGWNLLKSLNLYLNNTNPDSRQLPK